jgi:hypothetical protein
MHSIKWALVFSGLIFGAGQAHAVGRVFVASDGSDANTSTNCGLTTACRTFNAALSVVDAGGEIVVKDSAGYGPGPVNITKSVSIIAPPGVYAGISVAGSAAGITISDPSTSGISVVLKGLTINSLGDVGNAISMTSGASLVVEGCTIMGFSAANSIGIAVVGPINARISDTTIRNGYTGVAIEAGASASISNLHLFNFSNAGVYVTDAGGASPAASYASITNSDANNFGQAAATAFWAYTTSTSAAIDVNEVVVAGGGQGVRATSTSSTDSVSATVNNSFISMTTIGLLSEQTGAGGGSQITFSGTTLSGNATGAVNDTGGILSSDGTNLFVRNLSNTGIISTVGYPVLEM